MEFLRRLRLSRSDADGSAAAEEMGLDAFGTESASPDPPKPPAGDHRLRMVTAVLAALVLIEAVPAALWVRGKLRPPVEPGGVQAAALPVAAAIPLASCESASATPPPGANPTATATSGVAAKPPANAGARPERTVPAAAAPADRAALAGSVAVNAPVPMQVLLRGRVVGTTEAESFMLPVGTQELEFVNDNVGYRARRTVTVQAGRTTPLRLEAPKGTLHINAVPWAEVFLDGQRIGDTPIGNLQAAIGSRELVFRHPDFGERRATVLVTLKEPARISMDLRKK